MSRRITDVSNLVEVVENKMISVDSVECKTKFSADMTETNQITPNKFIKSIQFMVVVDVKSSDKHSPLKTNRRNEIVKQKYTIPFDTKVEIVLTGSGYNGRIGILGAKYPGNLEAHNVYFDENEFATFMDDEIIPVQNILTIDNLEYETLCKVFDHNYIYDTDRIIIKQKKFTYEEIETALEEYAALLAKIFSKDADFGEDGICLNDRGKVLELLNLMADDDYEKYGSTATAIEEAIVYEQWWTEGFRNILHGMAKIRNQKGISIQRQRLKQYLFERLEE